MSWWRAMIGLEPSAPAAGPRAMSSSVTEITINTPAELEEALRSGLLSGSGQAVTTETALKVATLFACLRLRTGAIANTPLGIKRRVDDRTREDATDEPAWMVFNRKPNKWQTPSQFKRMMEGHLLLRGNAYALKTVGVGGKLLALTPLHPDRVRKVQLPDMTLQFVWTRKDGRQVTFAQDEMFHLVGMSLDGINGLSVLHYAREAIGLSLAMEQHGSTVFKNGANVSGAFKLPVGRTLDKDKADGLRGQLDEFRAGGAKDGKVIVLEDGLEFQQMALTAEDAQWLASREFGRTDICMFMGVPPHLIGITSGNTKLGSSVDSQTQSYVTFNLEDSFVSWEEAVGLQCLDWAAPGSKLYARFNRNALVRGDIKTRWDAHVKAMQWGVKSPNQVLADEDENPREGGDIFYPPPNMTRGETKPGDDAGTGDGDVDS